MCDPRYSTNLRTLYGILVTYADISARDTSRGKPYRSELAAQLGCSKKTLDRTVLEGECAGIVRVEERSDPENLQLNDANVYHLQDAAFWRGEWTDPLEPGQTAAQVAAAVTAARVEAKRQAGIEPKGGRKRCAHKKPQGPPRGALPAKDASSGGSVVHDATPRVTGDAGVASPVTPNVKSPHENPGPDPSLPPSAPTGDARAGKEGTDGGPASGSGQPQPAAAVDAAPPSRSRLVSRTPGMQLLLAVGAEDERYLLTGLPLLHQSLMADGMLEEGWTPPQIRHVVCGHPLPDVVTTSVGAIISARLRTAARTGPPASAPPIPAQTAPPPNRHDGAGERPSTRSLNEAVDHRPAAECTECGAAGPVPGTELCPTCLGWPKCPACTGPSPRRGNPATGGVCSKCRAGGTLPRFPTADTQDSTEPNRCTGCDASDNVDSLLCARCTDQARGQAPELMARLDSKSERLALRLLRHTAQGPAAVAP